MTEQQAGPENLSDEAALDIIESHVFSMKLGGWKLAPDENTFTKDYYTITLVVAEWHPSGYAWELFDAEGNHVETDVWLADAVAKAESLSA